ncbi:MAG: PEP-CTERM sorting domain-containing protein [Cupriavidus sp.]|nr:MAG: PEP-CTERM sorting domain-containing protein [Cupriavidus sp.]
MNLPSPRSMNTPFSLLSRRIAALSLAGSLVVGASHALATDGTWISDAAGNWNTTNTAPWFGSNIASGVDANAYFNKIDITANRTVTLTENMTVGNLFFGDAGTTPTQTWALSRSAAQVLTLQTSSGTPTITVDNTSATISAVLGGTQGLAKAGAGALTLSGNNTFTGTVTVNAGTMTLNGTNAMTGIIVNAGTLTLGNNTSNASLSSVVVNGGTLDVWSTNAIGSNNINLASASSVLNASSTSGGNIVTISGNITGSGKINKTSNASTLVLNGDNTYSGGTTLTDGVLVIGSGLNNGLGTGTLKLGQGAFLASDNSARTITNTLLDMGSGNLRLGAVQGATTGLGDLTFTSTATVSLAAAKTWTVNNSTRVTFKNAWTANPGWNITKAGTGTLVFDGNFTGTNATGFIVNAGTLILNGSKTMTGAVTVNSGGTFGGNSPSMAGTFTVNAGGAIAPGDGGIGTLTATNLMWNGETSGAFAQMKFELSNVGGQSTSATADRLALGSGILSKGSGSIFTFDFLGTGAAGNTYTLMTFGSSSGFSVGDFTYTNLTDGLNGTFALNGTSLTFSVVPEPTTFALLGAGLMVTFFARRRRHD